MQQALPVWRPLSGWRPQAKGLELSDDFAYLLPNNMDCDLTRGWSPACLCYLHNEACCWAEPLIVA